MAKKEEPKPQAPKPQSQNSESRLDSYLSNVKQTYSSIGDQVKLTDNDLKETSKLLLTQAQEQRKVAERALADAMEDKRRLEGEKKRLDTALDDAKNLYSKLSLQAKQQLNYATIQEKKAAEALLTIQEKRTDLVQTNKAAFEVAMKNVNPSYLDDVRRMYSEREQQVRLSYSTLEEETKLQLAKVHAKQEAAQKALDKVTLEKDKLEREQKELDDSLSEVENRYSLLVKQAQLQLTLVAAKEKAAEQAMNEAVDFEQMAKAKEVMRDSVLEPPKPKPAEAPKPAAPKPVEVAKAEAPNLWKLPRQKPPNPWKPPRQKLRNLRMSRKQK